MPNPVLTPHALIDTAKDELTPVRTLARQRLNKNIAPSTIWRWVRKGCRGCKLEAVQVLGSWHTTPEAFGAFLTGQTVAALGNDRDPTTLAPRSAEKEAKLRKAGLLK